MKPAPPVTRMRPPSHIRSPVYPAFPEPRSRGNADNRTNRAGARRPRHERDVEAAFRRPDPSSPAASLAILTPLLHLLLPLLRALIALGQQLLHLRLLVRRERREDLAADAGLQHCHVGLYFPQRQRRRADRRLVHRNGLDRLLLGGVGLARARLDLLQLRAVPLTDVADQILLRLGEIELADRQAAEGAAPARTAPARAAGASAAWPLRQRRAAEPEGGRQDGGRREG